MSGLTFLEVTGMTSRKYGGGERALLETARQARERGHHLHILWEQRPTSDAFHRDLARVGAVSHVYASQGRPLRAVAHIARLIRAHGVDLVHAHFQPSMTSGLVAARLTRVPSLLTIHQILAPLPGQDKLARRSLALARARVRMATVTQAVSEAARQAYIRRNLADEGLLLHYLGIEPPAPERSRQAMRQELGIGPDRTVVACTAAHGHVKGIDVLLRAFAKARASRPDLFLLQIGGDLQPSSTKALERLASDLGVQSDVSWVGFRDDVPDLLTAADLYVQPSRDEGLGLALVEAAQSGLACIGSDTGGIPEVVEHGVTGLLVPRENDDALADAILALANDTDLRERLGAAARQAGRARFDLTRQTTTLLDRYEHIVQGR